MEKQTKIKPGWVILLILLAGFLQATSQNAELKATAPAVVGMGEQFRLSYSLNTTGDGFQGPDLRDFTILAGPSQSSQSSIQIINGQVVQSISLSFTYILTPTKEGKFSIAPASVRVGGKQVSSNKVNIEVVKPQQQQPNQRQRQTNPGQSGGNTGGQVNPSDFYVSLELNKGSVYQGEHLVATLKVYTRLDLVGFENMKFPSYDGFWSQDIETPQNIQLERQNVDGQIYNVGVIKKLILFPQRSGELSIEPFELDAVVRQAVRQRSGSVFDNFFGMGYQNVKVKASTKAKKITVKPLPGNKPEGFGGTVGRLAMTATVDKKEAKTNDAITLRVKFSGNGNLKLLDAPEVVFPADFEVYDPKVENNFKTSAGGMEGVKSFEWLMIPRHAGEFSIPSFSFSFFDPGTGQYKTLRSEEFLFSIAKGSDSTSVAVVSGLSKEDVRFIGKDIRFIQTGPTLLKPNGSYLFGSWLFWAGLAAPGLLFLVVFVLFRKKIKENQNIRLVRNKRANKVAKRRLRLAAQYVKTNQTAGFYEELLKALWGYFGDKLGIPVSELSRDNILGHLATRETDQPLTEELISILDDCEYARYAPASLSSGLQDTFDRATKLISRYEQILR